MNIAEVAAARKELAALRREVPQLTERLQRATAACVTAREYIEVRLPAQTCTVAVAMHKAVLKTLAEALR
mgnify:CR=1 FL=1